MNYWNIDLIKIRILSWKKFPVHFCSNNFLVISKGNWTKPCFWIRAWKRIRCLLIPFFLGKVGGQGPISCTSYQQLFNYVLLAECLGPKNPWVKNLYLDGLEGKGNILRKCRSVCILKNTPPNSRFGLIQFYNITPDPRSYWAFSRNRLRVKNCLSVLSTRD